MVDNDYTLEGRFEIANENMKQEMNELIIQILYKTGIRKTTTVMINGREFDAVEQHIRMKMESFISIILYLKKG